MKPDAIAIRLCETAEELAECVALQKEVWGFSDADLVPLRMFVVAVKIGGQAIGAYDAGRLVGFSLSLPGNRGGHLYLHSHMLAVLPSHRDLGLGRRIKLFQREQALARGYELIEWTFDPLEIKNAYFNIRRLGAIARRYSVNQYGMVSSPLQGGLPTDRLVAEWWLGSRRVDSLLRTGSCALPRIEQRIVVPAEIYSWKASAADRPKAAQVQAHNRDLFLGAFQKGLAVLGYERDEHGNGTFLLGRWDENWGYDEA